MPPKLGLYSLANTPEELLSQGYGMVDTEFAEDPAFGDLAYNTVYNPAPYTGDFPFQNVFRINEGQYYGDLDFPSFGGASNINYNQFKPEEVATSIPSQTQPFQFLPSAYEDQDEDAEQVDYLPGQEPSGIAKLLDYIPFVGEKSLGGTLLKNFLPKQSPQSIAMKNFYGSQFGLTPTGSVASGIMKGYNPVFGGFLNMITGGKFGEPTQYGLAGAMQRRIENILGRKAAQTAASQAKVAELKRLQLAEIRDRALGGESLSSIGKSTFSGPGMAFSPKTNTFSGGKTKTTGGVPGGKYGSPK